MGEWIWDNFGVFLVIIFLFLCAAIPLGMWLLDPHVESRGERFDRIEAELEILDRRLYCYERWDKDQALQRIACLENGSRS